MIYVNGKPVVAGEQPTIRDVLLGHGIDPDSTGIAIAVDSEVATRGEWSTRTLDDGTRIEIVQAVQGG